MSILEAVGSDDITLLRSTSKAMSGVAYLSVNPYDVVATARINMPGGFVGESVQGFAVDTLSANWADVRQGMTVLVGTAALASDVGVYRTRLDTEGTNYLYLMEISNGDSGSKSLSNPLLLADNQYVTVVLDVTLWSVFPRLTYGAGLADFFKDYDRPYTDQNEVSIPGILRLGRHRAGWVNSATGVKTEAFTATVAVWDSATVSSTTWVIYPASAGYTVTSGSLSAASFTAEFDPGCYIVHCTVVLSNGAEMRAYRMVYAHDPLSFPPVDITLTSDRLERGGRTVGLKLADNTSHLDLVQGSMAILWFEYDWGGETLDTTTTDQFPGFVKMVSGTAKEGRPPTITFELQSGYALLKELVAFSQQLSAAAAPVEWQEAVGGLLNIDFMLFYLLYYHMTALQLFDLYTPSLTNYASHAFAVSPGNMVSQLESIVRRVPATFGQGSDGTWWARRDPMLLHTTGSRNAVTTRYTLTEADIVDYSFRQNPRPPVGKVEGYAFESNTSPAPNAYVAQSPGKVPGQGLGTQTLDGQIVADQEELNIRTSLYRARLNNPYAEFRCNLVRGFPIFEPATNLWVGLQLSADYSPDGTAWDKRCLLSSVAFTYGDNGEVSTSIVLEIEVDSIAAPATTMPVKIGNGRTEADLSLPSYDSNLNLVQGFDLTSGFGLSKYKGVLGVPPLTAKITNTAPTNKGLPVGAAATFGAAWTSASLFISGTMTATTPIWSTETTPPDDPLDFVHYISGSTILGWLLTAGKLYYNTSILGSTAWTAKQTLTSYTMLRRITGVANGIAGYGGYQDTWCTTIDLTGTLPDSVVLQIGTHSGSGVTTTSYTFGGQTYGKLALLLDPYPGGDYTVFYITSIAVTFSETLSDNDYEFLWAYDDPSTGSYQGDYSEGLGVANPHTYDITQAGRAFYISCDVDKTPAHSDPPDGSLTITSLTICGTGFNPFDTYKVFTSDDTGTTLTTAALGKQRDDVGFDVDDYNEGVWLAAGSRSIYYVASYTDTTPAYLDSGDLDGLPAPITCVRIPYLKLASQLPNDDKTSLQFIYGTSKAVAGATLWGVTFDATSGTIAAQSDMTPIISGTTYYVVGANALETYGGNTQIIAALVEPLGGGTRRLIRSEDGGTTWTSVNTSVAGAVMVKFIDPAHGGDGDKLYVAGGAFGLKYSANGGATFTNKGSGVTGTIVAGYAVSG